MTLKITKLLFILSCIVMGLIWVDYIVGQTYNDSTEPPTQALITFWRLIGAAVACVTALSILFALRSITQELFERLFPVVIAIAIAMMLGYFAASYISMVMQIDDQYMKVFLTSTLVLLFGYVGISLGLTKASNWESLVSAVKQQQFQSGSAKLVDTSVLIDGRIADIVATGFIDGTLVVPRFVLAELQHISDSHEELRRTKGRRGLDILRSIQEDANVEVEILSDDPRHTGDVDSKLVHLAREYEAKIITNDFNLNKVAQIEGVEVLNINDLANALKPAALPDEDMKVKIVKEGKEAYQGVGYLDDGTMIVVDGGRSHMGEEVAVKVTSVLQTPAGRMIFTKMSQGAA